VTLRGPVRTAQLSTAPASSVSGAKCIFERICHTRRWKSSNWDCGLYSGHQRYHREAARRNDGGNLIFLDQLNDADTTAYSPINPDGPYVSGEYTSVAYPTKGYDRIQFQINRIAAINGNNITLTEPLYMPNWSASLSPQVWFETTPALSKCRAWKI